MRTFSFLKTVIATMFMLIMVPAFAAAQYGNGDQGQYQIVSARYGTERSNVDVTGRLRELAREDIRFRMGNSTFGVDPDPGVVKTLRIFARGPNGRVRVFEYREGSTIDGSVFTDWRRGGWGNGGWNGGWNGDADGRDDGQYRILTARYGTERRNIDVTARLRELAREDVRFRMGNSTFGVDPDPGAIKMLRIYARGPRGENRTFEYREGSTIDGSQFTGWGRGDWGHERWNGRWGRGDRDDDDRDDRRGNGYGDRDNGRYDSASITIVQATYGAGRYRRDVTNVLRNYVRDGRLVLTVSNESMGGDPAPNMRKNLTITYRTARGDQRQANVTEGGRLNLQ